jgi:hypothetical protein
MTAASYRKGALASIAVSRQNQVLMVTLVALLGTGIGIVAWYYGMYKPAAARFGSPESLAPSADSR